MEKEKFRISIIDFIPHHKTIEVGIYQDGTKAYIGDCVILRDEHYIIVYRYGKILLKQIGMMPMVGMNEFSNGDFSGVEKTNVVMSGDDWIIIGFNDSDEEMFLKLKSKGLL